MTLIRTLHPSGIYIDHYEYEPGELEAMELRTERIHTDSRSPVVTVASTLRKAMHEQKITHKEISESIGVSIALVSKWLHGQSLPNADNLRKLCELLRIDHLTTRKISGIDPVTIPSTADEQYAGASDAARAWNGSGSRGKEVAA